MPGISSHLTYFDLNIQSKVHQLIYLFIYLIYLFVSPSVAAVSEKGVSNLLMFMGLLIWILAYGFWGFFVHWGKKYHWNGM